MYYTEKGPLQICKTHLRLEPDFGWISKKTARFQLEPETNSRTALASVSIHSFTN